MNSRVYIELEDSSKSWYTEIIADHYDEACSRVDALLAEARKDGNGCLVTKTVLPKKLRFLKRQDRAYRFIFCVLRRYPATRDEVIRHRCHNRRCINPDHLTIGSRADNKRDDWEFAANGVDFGYI